MRTSRVWAIMIVALFMILAPLKAQEAIVISLSVPEFVEDLFSDSIINEFEAQNPGISVNIVAADGFGSPFNPQAAVEDYLNDVRDYASSADVFVVDSDTLTPEATRAGYLLDLSPLINSDPNFNSFDFFDPVLQSFNWDAGTWAVPVSAEPIVLYYDPAAFDAAGLAYPTPDWTIFDLDNAIRRLAQFDEEGNITVPGFVNLTTDLDALFISLLGNGLYDNSFLPNEPDYSNPELANLLSIWRNLEQEGFLTLPTNEDGGIDFGSYPLELGQSSFGGIRFSGDAVERQITLLPGGRAGLVVNGFGISSGTRYPEAAYNLVKFLSQSPEAAGAFFSGRPARRSLQGVEAESEGAFNFGANTTPEEEQVIIAALENGLPASELRFAGVISSVLADLRNPETTVQTALDDALTTQQDRLIAADARQQEAPLVVATPPPPVEVAPGEVILNFGVASFVNPLPNEDGWQAAAVDFAASDPQVGRVVIDRALPFGLEPLAEDYDCFYTSNNLVQDANDLSLLIQLDPLIATDPNVTQDTFVASVFEQVQINGQTFGLPISVAPQIMRHNPTLFANAGAFAPYIGWTIADFEQALRTLKNNNPDSIPYQPDEFGGAHLYTLIIAYGGLPFNYRTTPPTLNFSDPQTIEAIRQVLDLARDELMSYERIINFGGGGIFLDDSEPPALYSDTLGGFGGFGGGADGDQPQNTDITIPFPAGSQFNSANYSLSVAYISSSSTNVEACYRFISSLTQRSDLISAMPANRNLLNDPALIAAQGEDTINFYREFDNLLQQPNTLVVPEQSGLGAATLDIFWISRVFDDYVLSDEEIDLEFRLQEAEQFTAAFRECTAGIPNFQLGVDDPITYYNQFRDCAVRIDPSAGDILPELE